MTTPPIITLTTDFGLVDTYVGVMKGVMLGIAPHARLVDLTHEIAPQNIAEASLRLEAAFSYFPPGTIHLVVVDPGVGSERDAVVVETETYLFVAPDNGALTYPLRRQPARRVIRLGQAAQRYFRHPLSATFHGRDLFAPIAAHLAAGLAPDALIDDASDSVALIELPIVEPVVETILWDPPALRLHSLYADRFGNLVTDLTPALWEEWLRALETDAQTAAERVQVMVEEKRWRGFARAFAEVPVGGPLAYWGSAGRLEIALRDGSAADMFGAAPAALLLTLPE